MEDLAGVTTGTVYVSIDKRRDHYSLLLSTALVCNFVYYTHSLAHSLNDVPVGGLAAPKK